MSAEAARHRGLASDVTHTLIARLLCRPIVLVQEIIVARSLGPTSFGKYAFAILIIGLISVIFCGLGPAVTFGASSTGARPLRSLGEGLMVVPIVSLLVAAAAVWGYRLWPSAGTGYWLLIGVGASLTQLDACLRGFLLARVDVTGVNYAQVIAALVGAAAVMILLQVAHTRVNGALLGWLLANLGAVLWMWWRCGVTVSSLRAARPSWAGTRSLLPFAVKAGVANAISIGNYRADALLVEWFTGVAGLGTYSIALRIAEYLWFVPRALATAAYGRLGQNAGNQAPVLAVAAFRHTTLVILALATCIAVTAPFGVPAAFGRDYAGAVPVLLVLLPGNMCWGLAAVISVYFTNHVGAPQIPMKVSGLAMGINVVACLLLIPRLGTIGAAASSTVAYLTGIAVYCRIFVKKAGLPAWSLMAGRQEWREQILSVRSIVCGSPHSEVG